MDIELLKTKSLGDLREIAKLAGVKSVTTYKKSDLLQKLIDMANEAERQQEEQQTENSSRANCLRIMPASRKYTSRTRRCGMKRILKKREAKAA